MNAPADASDANATRIIVNETPLTHHQKLEAKRKDMHELICKTITKE